MALTRAEFDELYLRTAPALRSYIRRHVGDAETAADLLQDTFVRVLRAPPESRSEREMICYLYRAAYSVIVDHSRRERRERLWRLSFLRNGHVRPQAASDAERAFGQLKPKEQTLLWLAYVEEMTHGEIARVVNVEEHSVKVLLFRARKRLAEALKRYGIV